MDEMPDWVHEHWVEHGYVVAPLLEADEVDAVLDNIYDYLPPWEEFSRRRSRYGHLRHPQATWSTFPFVGSALNNVPVHPALVAFAERVLRTDKLLLNESQLIGKYAGLGDYEQELHVDFGNTTLACPPPDDQITDLPMIVYYTDVTVDLGPTHVVSKQHAPPGPCRARVRARSDSPDLYCHEVPVTAPAGSVLIYSMNTWHRGTAMTATEGARFSHHTGFRRQDAPWCGQFTFVGQGGRPEMDAFLVNANPRQRALVGFPSAGDPYWTPYTLAGVAARYPTMDLSPYEEQMGTRHSACPQE